jgi:hypothetical protein
MFAGCGEFVNDVWTGTGVEVGVGPHSIGEFEVASWVTLNAGIGEAGVS